MSENKKVKFMQSVISVKQALKLKRFKENNTPCTIIHHIHCDDDTGYECRVDCTNGYSEQNCIDAVNQTIAVIGKNVIQIDLHKILPLQDKPDGNEYAEVPKPTMPIDLSEN